MTVNVKGRKKASSGSPGKRVEQQQRRLSLHDWDEVEGSRGGFTRDEIATREDDRPPLWLVIIGFMGLLFVFMEIMG